MTDYETFANAASRVAFRRYVTRVAFQLTLSEPMIAALKYVRDDPGAWRNEERFKKGSDYDRIRALNTGNTLFITEMKALERRGLVWWDDPQPKKYPTGHKSHKLTRIGELTCEMLVEAGMMPSQALPEKARKRKAA